MAVITEKTLDELLDYLDESITNLARESFESLEIEGGFQEVLNFLDNQFDIRLENLLARKNSSTHHLESGMKNKAIQRKARIMSCISSLPKCDSCSPKGGGSGRTIQS